MEGNGYFTSNGGRLSNLWPHHDEEEARLARKARKREKREKRLAKKGKKRASGPISV